MISLRLITVHANRVEVDLITALLGLKVESEYAGQGDLDFLDGQAKTTVPAIDFASTTVNPFLAIRKAVRLQSEKLGSGLCCKANWCNYLCCWHCC